MLKKLASKVVIAVVSVGLIGVLFSSCNREGCPNAITKSEIETEVEI